ncbi:hypothetical protein NPS53_07925 [Pseudomonas putida]|uniref:hypothetical protein n=1 Tax=Pseudomonas putida TaxID=303 RepID=UPI0023636BAF|nr:hypothetical protein [Pseudomonas putida]MDD2139497.1 hypothetical protein [Pseudomonas putida]
MVQITLDALSVSIDAQVSLKTIKDIPWSYKTHRRLAIDHVSALVTDPIHKHVTGSGLAYVIGYDR